MKIIIILTLILFSQVTFAQSTDSLNTSRDIFVLAKQSSDSIVLRWAPSGFKVWSMGNLHGYHIDRYLISRGRTIVRDAICIPLTNGPVRPLVQDDWAGLVNQDQYAPIAAQALFGENFNIEFNNTKVADIVNKVRENEQRFGFALFAADMSLDVAKASGLLYCDKDVKPGEQYLYRIQIRTATDTLRGSVLVDTNIPYALPSPTNLIAQFEEKTVTLRWNKTSNGVYSAYVVERAFDGINFERISQTPVVTLSNTTSNESSHQYAIDSLDLEKPEYTYRVRGITPFGDLGPPSNEVHGRPVKKLVDVPFIENIINLDNRALQLQWIYPEVFESQISRFVIERGPTSQGIFSEIGEAKKADRSFVDSNPNHNNYYRIRLDGLEGERIYSPVYYAHLIDSIPPDPPTGLNAVIDTSGVLTLSWKKSIATDLYGYRVYRSNAPHEEMSQRTIAPVKQEQFIDTVNVNTLSEYIYYKVVAVDHSQNQSQLSDILKVSLPDKIAPQPPVFLPTSTDSSGVHLSWIRSSSNDVVEYLVVKKRRDQSDWTLLKSIKANSDTVIHFRDDAVEQHEILLYSILAVDRAGLKSVPATPVSAFVAAMVAKKKVTWNSPVINSISNSVRLSWKKLDEASVYKLYKSSNDKTFFLYKSIRAGDESFNDAIEPGQKVEYKITAVLKNGSKTLMSDSLEVKF